MARREFHTPETADAEQDRVSPPVRRAPAPLVVGSADDRAEIEADRVADEVLTRLQTGGAGEAHVHEGCHGVARVAAPATTAPEVGFAGGEISGDLTSRIEERRGGGSALAGDVRRRMEAGFGRSLGDVRVHADAESADLNRAVSARAFTTGRDIFFGQGEYQPDTAAGERVLAHELAHTQQGGGAARRTIHRWDIGAKKMDWAQTRSVGTVSSGQMVYFLEDSSGDKIAVKKEDREIGLGELAGFMHESLSDVKSVRHRALDQTDIGAIVTRVGDSGSLDPVSWAKLGKEQKANPKFARQLEESLKLDEGGLAAMSDFEVGRAVHAEKLNPPPGKMVAMTFASGDTAEKASGKADGNQMKPEKNRMRALLTDFKHMEQLGQMTAVDLFLGNKDRVFFGNLGNWIYDPYSSAMTAIDHVDMWMSAGFQSGDYQMDDLRSRNLAGTATGAVAGLIDGMTRAGDPDFEEWVKSESGYRLNMMEEAMERGLVAGRKLLVKTFTSTRFTIGGSKARQVKKAIKKAGREATATDQPGGQDRDSYYKLLKARAEWLKKN